MTHTIIKSANTEFTLVPMRAGVFLDTGDLRDPDQFDAEIAAALYHRYGGVVVGGLDLTRENFSAFTERMCDDFMPYIGGAKNDRSAAVKGNDTVMSVTGGAVAKKAIAPHGEMYYRARPPRSMFFLCLTPAQIDGETTLLDGVALWQALPDWVRRPFQEQKLVYLRSVARDEWPKIYKTSDIDEIKRHCAELGMTASEAADGSLQTSYTVSALQSGSAGDAFVNSILVWVWNEIRGGDTTSRVRFEDGSPIPKHVMRQIYKTAQDLTESIPWQPGDVAILDNSRMMHGRNAYQDDARDIILRMSFDALPDAPPLKLDHDLPPQT